LFRDLPSWKNDSWSEMIDTNIETSLLDEIESFCRRNGIAESTFGKRVVNDGKFVGRLRSGSGITTTTVKKVREYMSANKLQGKAQDSETAPLKASDKQSTNTKTSKGKDNSTDKEAFRFYDNRQKYLMFVNTCGEKWKVAERAGQELQHIHPRPPAVRIFDAGMGDGTVLTNLMRQMHQRFPTLPHYVVGKEISLEDVRLSMEKMPDRFSEHPATVMIATNLYYTEAPWLTPRSMAAAATLNWVEIPLRGNTAHEFHEQIADMQDEFAENWQVKSSAKTGNPLYVRPSVFVFYREDHKFLLDPIIPQPGNAKADYDLVIASQPYRARMPAEFKVQKVIAPLAKSLAPGGRLLGIHSCGGDPGLEIVKSVWPGENPFTTSRHDILRHLKQEIGKTHRDLNYNAYSDKRAIVRYDMHTLPSEVSGENSIGTSTLLAAWNAAVYVAQIEDERLEAVMHDPLYVDVTREVLAKHGGLWFYDESYVVSRRRT